MPDHDSLPPKEFLGSLNGRPGYVQLVTKNTAQFVEHRLADDEDMVRNDDPQHVRADASRGHCAHQDVRVEENPQETSRKMSSSVR